LDWRNASRAYCESPQGPEERQQRKRKSSVGVKLISLLGLGWALVILETKECTGEMRRVVNDWSDWSDCSPVIAGLWLTRFSPLLSGLGFFAARCPTC
jgi:hypothetical protein